ncbi:MAG TPA: glycosyltransferase, partial [Bacillota bacterium]|nr:glycosyltransferase [Bacillota bacterium]
MSRSAKVRVLQVIRPAAGGMKQHLKDLLLNLNRDRYELSLTGPIDNELQSLATELGIGVFPLDIHAELTPFNDLKTVFKLQSILRHIRPELVHAHGSKAGLLVRLAILLSQPYRLVLPPRSGPHVLITLHNMVYTGSLSGNKLRFMRFLEVLTAPFVQQFIAVS